MFVDKVKIYIKAGDGGDGAVSFHREKYVAAGGPDGGNGGKGGNIVFQVDTNLSTLLDFRYHKKYVAKRGENGGAKRCTGKSAPDLVIKVPRGTIVRNAKNGRIMADLSTDEPQILAKGGNGGRGNCNFATSTRQIPRFAKPGFPGEEFEVILELKLLADVGLVGYPNVGKSTLISVVSAAKPKIANYHFTTLTPVLGVVQCNAESSFVMADIPGLIEGASDGIGLGHAFLRHVERCRLILHVAANKCDMATEKQIAAFRNYIEQEKGLPFFCISAATTQGTKELVQAIGAKLTELPPILQYEPEPLTAEELAETTEKGTFEIEVEDGVYYIDAKFLEPILRTVNLDDYSSLQYFQKVLRSSGIIDKLEEMGIQEGDTVNLYGFEFDFVS